VRRRVVVSLAALIVCLSAPLTSARADGDPASDVLAAQTAFLPQDGDLSPAQQAQLAQLVGSATDTGFPLRVALIATRSDLGSVTALWRRPASYAQFLAQELSEVFRGTLLVVMPDGFGVARVGAGAGSAAGVGDALAGLARPGSATALGGATISAVQRLAAAAGHRLTAPRADVTRSAGAPSRTGAIAWVAFVVGAIAIVIAWAISLRVRPPRRRDGVASPHGS
jgi:hypothetical protein